MVRFGCGPKEGSLLTDYRIYLQAYFGMGLFLLCWVGAHKLGLSIQQDGSVTNGEEHVYKQSIKRNLGKWFYTVLQK